MNELLSKYRDGLEELLYINQVWGSLARGMGEPRFSDKIPTAWIEYEEDTRNIAFFFNPEFIMTLSTEELAGVILHETHHAFRGDLNDLTDTVNYPDQGALVKAQECTANDCIEKTFGIVLPDFVMRGETLAGVDMSNMEVFQAYKIFAEEQEQQENGEGDDSEQSEDSSDESNSSQGGSGDSSEQENDSSGDSDDSGESGEGTGGSGSGSPAAAGERGGSSCGGIIIPEGGEVDAEKILEKILSDVADDKGVSPQDLKDILAGDAPDSLMGGYSPTGAPRVEEAELSDARMNWRHLLAEINPKVMSAGRKVRKTQNNWMAQNRRLSSVYPKVILPKVEPVKPKDNTEGDVIPTFVIALDLSGSIDRRLVGMLQGLLKDIPSDLIRAFPCTWSTQLMEFKEETGYRVVRSGGTSINTVVSYVERVKRETGTDPYVLVITDGQYPLNHKKPGNKWSYMAVDRASMGILARHSNGDTVYNVKDFRE